MEQTAPQLLLILGTIVFITVVLMHLARKNSSTIWLYVVQSAAIALLLFIPSAADGKMSLLFVLSLGATVLVKIFVAPSFFFRLIKRHQLKFSSSTNLSMPVTLLALAAIVALNQTMLAEAFAVLSPLRQNLLLIASAGAFTSLFLLINRRGVLSQMLGILSLENCIVSFAVFAGLEQNPGLQLGIIFDILIWVIIASVFASMIYNHFGSLEVTEMKKLTE